MYTPTPVTTLEAFKNIIFGAQKKMSKDCFLEALEVIDYLENFGMPDPESYTLNKIIATSSEDFDAKIFLVLAPIYKGWAIDNTLSSYDFFVLFSRMQEAINTFCMKVIKEEGDITYPLTLNLPPLLLAVNK